MIIWITGQSGSGKTTLARQLKAENSPYASDTNFIVIDGDVIRKYWRNSFTEYGRYRNVRNAQALACFLHEEGFNVIVAMISPLKCQRDVFKRNHDVLEVYLYGRGRWLSSYGPNCYQPPEDNFLGVDTSKMTPEDARDLVLWEVARRASL